MSYRSKIAATTLAILTPYNVLSRDLSPEALAKIDKCYENIANSVYRPSAPFSVAEYISCGKASLPGCSTKSDSKLIVFQALENYTLSNVTARAVPQHHAREVKITPGSLAISPDKRSANVTLECRGWGCEPSKGGSPGHGYLEGLQTRHETREEVGVIYRECTK
jgi:hypothetical protein